jgi:hypothetical protein
MAINWDFIGGLEGGQQLNGYVPAVDVSESGVTIATGVDLAQRSENSIDALAIPDQLKTRLKPYVGLKKRAAVDFLARHPLTITAEEAVALDRAIRQGAVADVRARYDRAVADEPGSPNFDDLSEQAQTVICSVAFQYGSNLERRTPRFWRACTECRWDDLLTELRNFGDDHPTRRNQEADLFASSAEITHT